MHVGGFFTQCKQIAAITSMYKYVQLCTCFIFLGSALELGAHESIDDLPSAGLVNATLYAVLQRPDEFLT